MAESILTPYEELLLSIQNYRDEENEGYPRLMDLDIKDKLIFNIDLNSREINVPKNLLSVQYDHNAEVVYFKCPRYYGLMDLTHTVCVIEYINAQGDGSLYWVPGYDINHYQINEEGIEEPCIYFAWAIGGLVTAYEGEVSFAVKFYQLTSEGKYKFSLSTQPSVGNVLHGMDLGDNSELQALKYEANIVNQIYNDLAVAIESSIVYWREV